MIRSSAVLVSLALCVGFFPARSQAYLRGARYSDRAVEGGGGGRFFTGSPGDGYTCAVCHDGNPEGGPPPIVGVPDGVYTPGQQYALELQLDPGADKVAAVFEITDIEGNGAGLLQVVGADALTPCIGADEPPVRVASAPRERSVAVADACDVPAINLTWTAPAGDAPSVWLNAVVVTGNGSADVAGDTVYPLRRLLRPAVDGLPETVTGGTCSAKGSTRGGSALLPVALLWVLQRRTRRTLKF